jgi:hypothetical protein
MISTPRTSRPVGARACVLLVMAVLTGLVAMHGLGSAPMGQHQSAARHQGPASADRGHGSEMTGRGYEMALTTEVACHHRSYGQSGGHLDHADTTCAASGVSSGPSVAAPAPGGVAAAGSSEQHGVREAASAPERAPPSLSQLQLLRI